MLRAWVPVSNIELAAPLVLAPLQVQKELRHESPVWASPCSGSFVSAIVGSVFKYRGRGEGRGAICCAGPSGRFLEEVGKVHAVWSRAGVPDPGPIACFWGHFDVQVAGVCCRVPGTSSTRPRWLLCASREKTLQTKPGVSSG